MMRRKYHSPTEDDSTIDMTPMLDIVFIMLIFFIVTASFVKETGIDIARPDAKTAVEQSKVAILIAIDRNNEIWINRRKITLAALRANVERLRAENPQGGAVIQADKIARTGILVRVMDRLRQAGITKISIATREK
jgi:biopolymer transport protein ExbD